MRTGISNGAQRRLQLSLCRPCRRLSVSLAMEALVGPGDALVHPRRLAIAAAVGDHGSAAARVAVAAAVSNQHGRTSSEKLVVSLGKVGSRDCGKGFGRNSLVLSHPCTPNGSPDAVGDADRLDTVHDIFTSAKQAALKPASMIKFATDSTLSEQGLFDADFCEDGPMEIDALGVLDGAASRRSVTPPADSGALLPVVVGSVSGQFERQRTVERDVSSSARRGGELQAIQSPAAWTQLLLGSPPPRKVGAEENGRGSFGMDVPENLRSHLETLGQMIPGCNVDLCLRLLEKHDGRILDVFDEYRIITS